VATVDIPMQKTQSEERTHLTNCAVCGTVPVEGDQFCGACGAALAAAGPRPGGTTSPTSGLAGPDVAAVTAMAASLPPRPVAELVARPAAMCLACGVDVPPNAGHCADCGAPILSLVAGAPTAIGSLHQYRKALRKRLAIRISDDGSMSTLLMHDGSQQQVPSAELPMVAHPSDGPSRPVFGPRAIILRRAVEVETGQAELPWSSDVLYQQVFAPVGADISLGRLTALDVLALGRPDLLARCGLSATETAWLRMVEAARRQDGAAVVDAVLALPMNLYRRKIAVLAAMVAVIERVPHAGARLAPVLAPFMDGEPLAALVNHRLGLTATDSRQRLADLALLAERITAPESLRALAARAAAGEALTAADAGLLGGRGRVAVLHGDPTTAARVLESCDVDSTPLPIMDDFVDAGVLGPNTYQHGGRDATGRSYLLARIAPELLSDAEVKTTQHHEEALRRAVAAGDDAAIEAAPASPMRGHLAAVVALRRNRPDDVVLDDLLPAHRTVARQFIAVQRAPDSAAPELTAELMDDRTTWWPLVNLLGTERLLAAIPPEGSTHFADWLALVAAREHLYIADWSGAAHIARRCLTMADAEVVRDEAQNLLACALHNLGDDRGALRELSAAIEGEYSVALLANIGVVAAQLDPELAARNLARVVREAPTLAMRMNAAKRAVLIWQSDESAIWQGEGDDEGERRLPTVLREPLRSLANQPISEDDFRTVLTVLSKFDGEWLLTPKSIDASPHRTSLVAKYYRAAAHKDMFSSVVDVFAEVKDWSSAPEWLVDQRDALVEQTIDYLGDNIDDPDNVAGMVAVNVVRKVRELPQRERIMLSILGVATIVLNLNNHDEEMADHLLELFMKTRAEVGTFSAEDQENLAGLIAVTIRRIALNLHGVRARELNAMIKPYNEALRVLDLVQSGHSLWFTARRQVAETVEASKRAIAQLNQWLVLVDNVDIRSMLADLINEARDFETKGRWVLDH
jgi:hypothetical protein